MQSSPVSIAALHSALCVAPFSFFYDETAPTETYTLSLHDALPISSGEHRTRIGMLAAVRAEPFATRRVRPHEQTHTARRARSEEHTSELQSHHDLVCRLLLEKKKKKTKQQHPVKD